MAQKHQILIVGGGFGGVRAARLLASWPGCSVTLLSDRTEFAYYPQLYHAATGGTRSEASIPLAQLLHRKRVRIVRETAVTFDPAGRTVTGLSGARYRYDELILALGSVTNYFGIKGLREFAYDIKTIDGAEAFKERLHTQLIGERRPEQHYVIVGGGPTGVELAGALSAYLERIIALHGVARPHYRIDLIEAAPRLLPHSPAAFARRVERRLRRLGVTIHTGTAVKGETATRLRLKDGQITSRTVVWTSGVANNPFFADNAHHLPLAPNGRVNVNDHLEAGEHVYVIGDNAATRYGGLAETAVNDANFVAGDIWRKLSGRRRPAYRQPKPPTVIPVGPGWAAAEYKGLRLYGRLGWWLRRAADLVAYRDIESTPQAVGTWLRESTHEDDCPTCLQLRPTNR